MTESEEKKGKILRDSRGRFLPGTVGFSGERKYHGKGKYLSDLIKLRFGDEMEVYLDNNLTRLERREIMADSLAQLISTGEVKLPDRIVDGKRVPGKVFKYNGSEWLKHLIRVLRYVEPPAQEIEVSGGVEGIVFDDAFFEAAIDEINHSDEVQLGKDK